MRNCDLDSRAKAKSHCFSTKQIHKWLSTSTSDRVVRFRKRAWWNSHSLPQYKNSSRDLFLPILMLISKNLVGNMPKMRNSSVRVYTNGSLQSIILSTLEDQSGFKYHGLDYLKILISVVNNVFAVNLSK